MKLVAPQPMTLIRDYTVIYTDGNGQRREYYLKAKSPCSATLAARELLPQSCEITRVYHNPDWR